jgi:hypothetical protein
LIGGGQGAGVDRRRVTVTVRTRSLPADASKRYGAASRIDRARSTMR